MKVADMPGPPKEGFLSRSITNCPTDGPFFSFFFFSLIIPFSFLFFFFKSVRNLYISILVWPFFGSFVAVYSLICVFVFVSAFSSSASCYSDIPVSSSRLDRIIMI